MTAAPTLTPLTEADVADAIADAARNATRLELRGGGSKSDFGAPRNGARELNMCGLAGVVDYDPAELVLTARAGTPLREIEALIASQNQMLAFEPFDHGPIFGRTAGAATLGGIVSAGVAGSRRLSRGSVRDHLLGFRGVSGRGEAFVAGAKVVKNVTGYDLPKLVAGSWGRLLALTEVTLKVVPGARVRTTLFSLGLNAAQAHRLMADAMGSQADVAAAAHVPAATPGDQAMTALRVEGFGPSVAARCEMLLKGDVTAKRLFVATEAEAAEFWRQLQSLSALPQDRPLWRVNVPPSGGCGVVSALEPLGARWLFDWSGGLVWLAFDGPPQAVRRAAEAAGGHAILVRGSADLRARIPALHPQPPAVEALEARLREAFDPSGVFETGRFPAASCLREIADAD